MSQVKTIWSRPLKRDKIQIWATCTCVAIVQLRPTWRLPNLTAKQESAQILTLYNALTSRSLRICYVSSQRAAKTKTAQSQMSRSSRERMSKISSNKIAKIALNPLTSKPNWKLIWLMTQKNQTGIFTFQENMTAVQSLNSPWSWRRFVWLMASALAIIDSISSQLRRKTNTEASAMVTT